MTEGAASTQGWPPTQMGDFVNNIHTRNPYEAEVGMTQHLSRVKFRKPRLIGKSTENRNSIKM